MAKRRKRDRASDDNYNARRRFIREAKRAMQKAQSATGEMKKRYRNIARESIQKAAELYTRHADIQRSKDFVTLSKELGINLSEFQPGKSPTPRETVRMETLRSESQSLMNMSMREREAQAILSSPIGSRIYAGLVDVWAKPTFNADGELVYSKSRNDINKAIMEYFGTTSMMDVLEMLEAQGINIYADPKSMEKYDEITLAIAEMIYR